MNQNISAEVSHEATQREYSAVTARNIGLFLLALSTPFFASCDIPPAPTPEAPGEDAGDDVEDQVDSQATQAAAQATGDAVGPDNAVATAQAVAATGEAKNAGVELQTDEGSSLQEITARFNAATGLDGQAVKFNFPANEDNTGNEGKVVIVTPPFSCARANGEISVTGGAFYAQNEQGEWVELVKISEVSDNPSLEDAMVLGVGDRFSEISEIESIKADSFVVLEEGKRVLIRFTVVFNNGSEPISKLVVFDDNDKPFLLDLSQELRKELMAGQEIAALGTDWLIGSGGSLPGVVLSEADFDSLPDTAVVGINEDGQRVIRDGEGTVLFVEVGEVGGDGWERVEAELPIEAPVFIPEGFQVSELGLLQDPETGRDVLAMNPEADWERVREEIIGGLWLANMDWYQFTGEGSDAQNYSSKEAFIKAALEGETFRIGIPVRLDENNIPEGDESLERSMDRFVVLKMVDITLDNIQIQILSSDAFVKYTGRGWLGTGQEAYDCASYPGTSSNVILFTNNAGGLMISLGSFYLGDQVIVSKQYSIGNFNPELYKNYPSYFRPDGIGIEADNALSFTLGYALDEFDIFSNAHYTFTGANGEKIKIISIGKTMGYPDEESYYLNPLLFVFNQ